MKTTGVPTVTTRVNMNNLFSLPQFALKTSGIRAIRGYPKRIRSYSEARSIRGVGDKTALKVRVYS